MSTSLVRHTPFILTTALSRPGTSQLYGQSVETGASTIKPWQLPQRTWENDLTQLASVPQGTFIINLSYPKNMLNFGHYYTFLEAADGIIVHEIGQENDYGALIRLLEEQKSRG